MLSRDNRLNPIIFITPKFYSYIIIEYQMDDKFILVIWISFENNRTKNIHREDELRMNGWRTIHHYRSYMPHTHTYTHASHTRPSGSKQSIVNTLCLYKYIYNYVLLATAQNNITKHHDDNNNNEEKTTSQIA